MPSQFLKQKSAFGLELSESSLRVMQLRHTRDGIFPSSFSQVPTPKGIVSEGKIINPEKAGELIRETLKKPMYGQIETPYVVLSVPESKSFVRVISVLRMSDEEAKEAVPLEAEQYIPMSAEQVYLDFQIVPGRIAKDPEKMKVVICATPKDLIEGYVNAAKLAKLRPVAVEVESQAVVRSLIDFKAPSKPTLILDIGSLGTNLIIFDQGALQFTSSLPVGGNSFTGQISQSLTVSAEEAEKLKRQFGLVSSRDGGRIKKLLSPVLNSLTEAVKNTMNFYFEHSDGNRKIALMLLSGGGSQVKGLTEFLQAELKFGQDKSPAPAVGMGDPWINVLSRPLKKIPPISKTDSLSFSTVIGLALRGLDME